ncbi:hypothetical protein HCTV-16_gp18 [Haloarcula virus HCTV-16]|nr:hypothetical protein HCTV-16_gp18 [Haloarcula virus HCTV-16]
MNELIGEPVAEADRVYNPGYGQVSDSSVHACWRYYYLDEFWDARLLSPRCENLSDEDAK